MVGHSGPDIFGYRVHCHMVVGQNDLKTMDALCPMGMLGAFGTRGTQ